MIVGGAKIGLVINELGALHFGAYKTRLEMILDLMDNGGVSKDERWYGSPGHKAALDEIEEQLARVRATIATAEQREAAQKYTVYAVKEEDGATFRCADDDPERRAFGLYMIDGDNLCRWVSDHPTMAEAEASVPTDGILLTDD